MKIVAEHNSWGGGERKIEKIRKGELCELMERKKWASNTGGKVKQSKDGKLQIPGQQNGLCKWIEISAGSRLY